MSDLYMSWFDVPDVIVVYPVYMMDRNTQKYRLAGFRAALNRVYRRANPRVALGMKADEHTLAQVCMFVFECQKQHADLRKMRVMYVDQHEPEKAQQIDLTTEDATLLSILQIG